MLEIMNAVKTGVVGVVSAIDQSLFVHAAGSMSSFKDIMSAIVDIFPWIGFPFAIYGGLKLLMAIRNDSNPEAISAGTKDVVVGLALICFRLLLWPALSGLM